MMGKKIPTNNVEGSKGPSSALFAVSEQATAFDTAVASLFTQSVRISGRLWDTKAD